MNNNYIKNEINATKYRKQDLNRIRTLFDLSEKSEFTIDNQTWDDLIMDEVFRELDIILMHCHIKNTVNLRERLQMLQQMLLLIKNQV